jgi:hypothetical protein
MTERLTAEELKQRSIERYRKMLAASKENDLLREILRKCYEKLTAEELDELIDIGEEQRRYKFETTEIPTATLDKLIAAAEEAERLRAAIEKHRDDHLEFSKRTPAGFDQTLWEVLK